MLYGTCCNRNINLVHAAIIVGVYDVVFMLLLVVFHYDFLFKFEIEQMFYISSLSIGIVAAIMLIHGAMKLNRLLVLYWLCIAGVRLILQSAVVMWIMYLVGVESLHSMIDCMLELLDYVVLISTFIVVWKLYKELKHRDENSFRPLQEFNI